MVTSGHTDGMFPDHRDRWRKSRAGGIAVLVPTFSHHARCPADTNLLNQKMKIRFLGGVGRQDGLSRAGKDQNRLLLWPASGQRVPICFPGKDISPWLPQEGCPVLFRITKGGSRPGPNSTFRSVGHPGVPGGRRPRVGCTRASSGRVS